MTQINFSLCGIKPGLKLNNRGDAEIFPAITVAIITASVTWHQMEFTKASNETDLSIE